MLSLVAGVVNINGVLSIHTLTTNVTGHFAFLGLLFAMGLQNALVTKISKALYHQFSLRALLFAAGSLMVAMLYDNILYNFHTYWRKWQAH